MFMNLKRKDRELKQEEIYEISVNGKYGVLSLIGEEGYPYGVPVHYCMIDDELYFHCSSNIGHLIKAIHNNPNICFTVVETNDGIKCKSVIGFGRATIIKDKRSIVLEKIVEKFIPEVAWKSAKAGIPYALENVLAVKIQFDHISGKWIDKPAGK